MIAKASSISRISKDSLSTVISVPANLPNNNFVPTSTLKSSRVVSLIATIVPIVGFSLFADGIKIPPAVFVCASCTLTTTLVPKGLISFLTPFVYYTCLFYIKV
jgi:hypothetical protein